MENAHIVVVDDNKFIVDILSQALTREGYTVSSASGGREGLALIQNIQPDLVLTKPFHLKELVRSVKIWSSKSLNQSSC